MSQKWNFVSVISLLTLIIFLLILAASIVSTRTHFVPDESFTVTLKYPSYIFSILLILSFSYFLYKNAAIREKVSRMGWKRIFLTLFVLLMFWGFTSMFQDAVPLLLHQMKSVQGDKEYTIINKSHIYHEKRGRCDGAVYIHHSSISTVSICGLSENDWNTVKKGDGIKVYGAVSNYGMSYDRYFLIHN